MVVNDQAVDRLVIVTQVKISIIPSRIFGGFEFLCSQLFAEMGLLKGKSSLSFP